MAKLLKLRRGTTTQHGSFTGAEGEVTIDTTKDTAVVHDGSQAGGRPLAREDMNNVSSANILGRISNGDIVGTKLENSGVTAGQYGSSSAIPIVTVDAQGLVTAASTTAIDSTTISNGSSSVSVANNGAITSNANHDFSAGIDVTGNITNTGTITSGGNIEVSNTYPSLVLTDTNHNSDYRITNNDGQLIIFDSTNGAHRLNINADGHVDILGNLDVGSGIDLSGGHITLPDQSSGNGKIKLGAGVDLQLYHDGTDSFIDNSSGSLYIRDTSGGDVRIQGKSGEDSIICHDDDGVHIYYDNAVKLTTESYGVNVTGNINVSGTVDGVDIAAFKTAFDEAFPSGTKMLFQQTSAPTGWTKITSGVENKALRVTSGTAGSGGTNQFTNTFASVGITANAGNATAGGNVTVANATVTGNVSIDSVSTSGNVNSHTLSSNEMPSHRHNLTRNNNSNYWNSRNNIAGFSGMPNYSYISPGSQYSGSGGTAFYTDHTGGGGGHTHGFTGSSHTHSGTLSAAAHTHNASFTGSAHNHSISVNNIDLAVQYLDVIIASKD